MHSGCGRPRGSFSVTPSSDGIAITAIARAYGHGVAETTATGPGGDDGGAPAGAAGDVREAVGLEGCGHRPPGDVHTSAWPRPSRRALSTWAFHLCGVGISASPAGCGRPAHRCCRGEEQPPSPRGQPSDVGLTALVWGISGIDAVGWLRRSPPARQAHLAGQ
jgi:hypothetical protein